MMMSSEAEVHQKHVHQKRLHQKLKIQDLILQKLFNGLESNAEGLECEATVMLRRFKGIGCLSSNSIDSLFYFTTELFIFFKESGKKFKLPPQKDLGFRG
jgi:hypothetical protein